MHDEGNDARWEIWVPLRMSQVRDVEGKHQTIPSGSSCNVAQMGMSKSCKLAESEREACEQHRHIDRISMAIGEFRKGCQHINRILRLLHSLTIFSAMCGKSRL